MAALSAAVCICLVAGTSEAGRIADAAEKRAVRERLVSYADAGLFDGWDEAGLTKQARKAKRRHEADMAASGGGIRAEEDNVTKTARESVFPEPEADLEPEPEPVLESDMEPAGETAEGSGPEEAEDAAPDGKTEPEADARAESAEEEAVPDRIIFAGDSRFAGMAKACAGEADVYVAKTGSGLAWLRQSADAIRRAETDGSVVVIGSGVNDLRNADGYVEFANAAGFRSRTIFLTVGPVDESKFGKFGNAEIEAFNEKLKAGAENYEVADAYAFLTEGGFGSPDGLHYTAETYGKLHGFIYSAAGLEQEEE